MNVLFVTTSYPIRCGSSSGIFVKRLVSRLSRSHSVKVVVPADASSEPICVSQEGLQILDFRYAPRRWQVLAHSPGGIPVALRNRPWMYLMIPFLLGGMFLHCLWYGRNSTVIHANWAITGLIAGLAGRLVGVPVVVTLRGEDVGRSSRKAVNRWILKKGIALCNQVVGVSEAIVADIKQQFPQYSDKCRLIENGVGDGFLSIRRSVCPKPQLRLLSVGSLIPRKGMNTIIDAVAGMTEISLTVIGDGQERKNLVRLIEKYDLSHRVRLVGWVSPDEMPEFFAEHDVLVLASYSEGRPNVVLEAMAAAMPVVASAINGVDELVQPEVTGMLFPPGDSDALASCIERLLQNDRLMRDMGNNGRKYIVDQELSWEKTAEKYSRVYGQIVTGVC